MHWQPRHRRSGECSKVSSRAVILFGACAWCRSIRATVRRSGFKSRHTSFRARCRRRTAPSWACKWRQVGILLCACTCAPSGSRTAAWSPWRRRCWPRRWALANPDRECLPSRRCPTSPPRGTRSAARTPCSRRTATATSSGLRALSWIQASARRARRCHTCRRAATRKVKRWLAFRCMRCRQWALAWAATQRYAWSARDRRARCGKSLPRMALTMHRRSVT
mmetsp:Transcript_45253/g.114856  ORF Transcript_45253/g.114856 Transcript_45253/m.114856 type:complete len:222 (-) Transcript_45253:1033-1698(-)